MSTVVERLYLATKFSSGCFIKRGIYTNGCGDRSRERGGRFNVLGRGRGRGGRSVLGRGGGGQVLTPKMLL